MSLTSLRASGLVHSAYIFVLRPYDPENKLDFQAVLPDGRKVFINHKMMIDFKKLAKEKNVPVEDFPSHETVAFKMGKDSVKQKSKHIPVDDGIIVQKPGFPYSPSEVYHIYNFNDMLNHEVPGLVQAVLNGAEQAGLIEGQGMLFLMNIDLD